MTGEIKRQVRDLMGYYPGRGRLALVWLVVIPALCLIVLDLVFGRLATNTATGGVPIYLFGVVGSSVSWLYRLPLLIMLVRICRSERNRLRESVEIGASSLAYGLLVGLPFLLLAFLWCLGHVGASAASLAQVAAGTVLLLGSLNAAIQSVAEGWLEVREDWRKNCGAVPCIFEVHDGNTNVGAAIGTPIHSYCLL